MGLETSTEVDKIEAVQDRDGELRPAATADEQERTNDRLGNFASGADGEQTDDGTGSALSAGSVPEGVDIVVQAKHDNASRIKVGLSDNPTVQMAPGQSSSFRVADRSQITIVATDGGDGVNWTHEVSA